MEALGNDVYVFSRVKQSGNVNVVIHHYAADVKTVGRNLFRDDFVNILKSFGDLVSIKDRYHNIKI